MAATGTGAGPRILGLTGPIGCGKTTVGDILLDLGALERVDADRVVHALMVPGTPTTARIRDQFGESVIAPDGSVDRRRLAEVVFNDPDSLRSLEGITHPAVRQAIREMLARMTGRQGVVVVDAVKLLQSDLLLLMDAVWVVRCTPEAQLQRLTQNRGMSPEAAKARVLAQPQFEHPSVTAIIENSGSMQALRDEVIKAWDLMQMPGVDSP